MASKQRKPQMGRIATLSQQVFKKLTAFEVRRIAKSGNTVPYAKRELKELLS